MGRGEALCPNFEDHAFEPAGYIEWHAWAKQMSKTHRQSKCAGCGKFKIWTPKKARAATSIPQEGDQ